MQEQKSKHVNIILTDIKLHPNKLGKAKPWYRMIMKSFRNKLPGRFFGKINPTDTKGLPYGQFKFKFGLPTAEELYQIPELRGKTVHFYVPKAGLPVFADEDVDKLIEARKNRKWKSFERFVGFNPSKSNNS